MEIIWSETASRSLFEVISYVEQHFGREVAIRVRLHIEAAVHKLSSMPTAGVSYPILDNEHIDNLRYILVKKSKVFYTIRQSQLIILLVWDMRRNPSVLEKLLTQSPL
jgi:plasmid stabilization system protein ParE